MKQWKWVLALMVLLMVIAVPTLSVFSQNTTLSSGTKILWYGQSAFKLTTPSGKVLLIDPFITNPANPNGKEDIAKLDRVDLILVTHGHFDHTGNAVEIAQKTKAKLVSTSDLGQAMVHYNNYPKDLVPLETQGNFGGELSLLNNEVKIAFIPAIHSSSIASDGSPANYAGNPGGFLISIQNGPVIYHTGDTDLFADMALIPQFRPVTLMLTCIGGQYTMGPERAATAVKLVNPKMVVPMHFGIFSLPGTPEAFAKALQQQGVKTQFKRMQVGETFSL